MVWTPGLEPLASGTAGCISLVHKGLSPQVMARHILEAQYIFTG